MDGLVLCIGVNENINAILIRFALNADVLGIMPVCFLPIAADIDRTGGDGCHICNGLQNFLLNFVQHVPFTSKRSQEETVSARIFG